MCTSLLQPQHTHVLLKWQPMREEIVSVDNDDLYSVFILLTKLKTRSLSASDAGIDNNCNARVDAPIGDFRSPTQSQNFTALFGFSYHKHCAYTCSQSVPGI